MEKLCYPVCSTILKLTIDGVFATPDQWKTTDEANPGIFGYCLKMYKMEMAKGKIYPKQLTVREQREEAEKSKKGGKKEAKKEQSAEQEKQRLEEQEQQSKREEQWNALSEQEQYHRGFEDPFRSAQLRFDPNITEHTYSGKDYVILEDRICRDGGEWLYFYKYPAVSEDQLAKMKKAKPKTLANANDLNPCVMRAWVDFGKLKSDKETCLEVRCMVEQIEKNADSPQPSLEKTYIKIKVQLDKPFVGKMDPLRADCIVPSPPEPEPIDSKQQCLNQLKSELRVGVQSLAMEYSAMFFKELNIAEQLKNHQLFHNKKNDQIKRKEHFLYDFNVSGKYKILKDRIKKSIVHLCQSYFIDQLGQAKTFSGISCNIRDQFYSKIYNFLVQNYKDSLKELIKEKEEILREVEVISPECQKKNIEKYIAKYCQQTKIQRCNRVVEEYQLLFDYKYGEQWIGIEINKNNEDVQLKYCYGIYCLKHQLKMPVEVLPLIEEYLSFNKNNSGVQLQYLLLLVASQQEENCKKSWVILRELIKDQPTNVEYLLLASLLFKHYLGSTDCADKYYSEAQRLTLRQNNQLPQEGKHKEQPQASQIPSLKEGATCSQKLQEKIADQLWIKVLMMFAKLNLVNVVEKVKEEIKEASAPIFDLILLKGLVKEGKNQEFQTQGKQVYSKTNSAEILELLIEFSFKNKNYDEAEKYLLKCLQTSRQENETTKTLLRLAYLYLCKSHFGNARACILKYLEKKSINSGLSWRLLGISELFIGNIQECIQSLRQANLSDPNNKQNWIYLASVYAKDGKFLMSNQSLNQFENLAKDRKTKVDQYEMLLKCVKEGNTKGFYEEKVKGQVQNRFESLFGSSQ